MRDKEKVHVTVTVLCYGCGEPKERPANTTKAICSACVRLFKVANRPTPGSSHFAFPLSSVFDWFDNVRRANITRMLKALEV